MHSSDYYHYYYDGYGRRVDLKKKQRTGQNRLPGKHGSAASREGVRMLLTEDVADTAARDDLQAAAALPHAKRDLCRTHTHIPK